MPRALQVQVAVLVLGVACARPPASKPEPPAEVPTDPTEDSGTVPTEDTADTGPPSDTGPTTPVARFDCSGVPTTVGAAERLASPRAYNDVVFTVDGGLVGWDAGLLLEATAPDEASVYAAGVPRAFKLGRLPGGDLVATVETGDVVRVQPNGNSYTLAPGVFGYGLAVGPDGQVYVSTSYEAPVPAIVRIDPDTGDAETWLELPYLSWPRDIDFSRDLTVLYIGTQWYGEVLRVPLDDDHAPAGEPELLVTLPTQWHDTVEVDACGQLYVAGLFPPQLHRVGSGPVSSLLATWLVETYAHGLQWGEPPWDEQAVYLSLPDQDNAVDELWLGVPGRQWSGEVIGGSTL